MVYQAFHFVDWCSIYSSAIVPSEFRDLDETFPHDILELVREAGFVQFVFRKFEKRI
jgi:hypothetical protein